VSKLLLQNKLDNQEKDHGEGQEEGQAGLLVATEEGVRSPERHEMQGRLFVQASLLDMHMLARADYLTDEEAIYVDGKIEGTSTARIKDDSLDLIAKLGKEWFDRGCPKTRRLRDLSEYGGMGFLFTAVVNEDGEVVEVIKES
jgi:hypothetical protein